MVECDLQNEEGTSERGDMESLRRWHEIIRYIRQVRDVFAFISGRRFDFGKSWISVKNDWNRVSSEELATIPINSQLDEIEKSEATGRSKADLQPSHRA